MRWWKILGLAAFASVAASGIVIARDQRRRRAYTPEEIRARLHARLAEASATPPAAPATPGRNTAEPELRPHTQRHDSVSDRCHPGNKLWSLGRTPGTFEIGCGVTVLGGEDARDWSQRYKANLEKLASGDLVQVVEVVRDLAGREASRGLSAGEKRMLAKARLILLQEG
jgi:hypothetical protein